MRHGKTLQIIIRLTDGLITFCSGSSCPPSSQFFIDLNDSGGTGQGKGGWHVCVKKGKCQDDTISVQAIPEAAVPEPATLLLVATGVGGIWFRRKRQ